MSELPIKGEEVVMEAFLAEARRMRRTAANNDDRKQEIKGFFYPDKRREHFADVDSVITQLAGESEEAAGKIVTLFCNDQSYPSVMETAGKTREEMQALLDPAQRIYTSRLVPYKVIEGIGRGEMPPQTEYKRGFMLHAWQPIRAELAQLPAGYESVAQQMQRDLLGTSEKPGEYYLIYFKQSETEEPCGYVTARVPPKDERKLEAYRMYVQRELLGEKVGDEYSLVKNGRMRYRSNWEFEKMVENQIMRWGEIDTVCMRPKSGLSFYEMSYRALQFLQEQKKLPKSFYSFRWSNAFSLEAQSLLEPDEQLPTYLHNQGSGLAKDALGWEYMATRADPADLVARGSTDDITVLRTERVYSLVSANTLMENCRKRMQRLQSSDHQVL